MADIMPPPSESSPSGRRKREPREQISAGLRYDVLRRCNFACYYCGVPAALGLKVLHVDHVIPVSLGGTNDPWNLVAACWDCNLGKACQAPTPELIEQVRDDYASDISPRHSRVDRCRFCRLPITSDPEDEVDDQCYTCLDIRSETWREAYHTGYSRGYHGAFDELDEALRKRGGAQ